MKNMLIYELSVRVKSPEPCFVICKPDDGNEYVVQVTRMQVIASGGPGVICVYAPDSREMYGLFTGNASECTVEIMSYRDFSWRAIGFDFRWLTDVETQELTRLKAIADEQDINVIKNLSELKAGMYLMRQPHHAYGQDHSYLVQVTNVAQYDDNHFDVFFDYPGVRGLPGFDRFCLLEPKQVTQGTGTVVTVGQHGEILGWNKPKLMHLTQEERNALALRLQEA